MTPEPIQVPLVDQAFEDRWATWEARGAANDRATKHKAFIMMAAILIFSVAVLSAWLLK